MRSTDQQKLMIQRAFDAASTRYDEAAVLQGEVRARMLERLDLVQMNPARILDVGAGTGDAGAALSRRFKKSQVICLDLAIGMLCQARRRRSFFHKLDLVCADAARIPLQSSSVDLIFCNLMLQWCNDLDTVFREFARILKPRGLVTLSTFGPDTLTELRQAFAEVDDYVHVNEFIDMHEIGDAMIRAGLVEPVLDVEMFTLTYERVTALMRDLKAIGANTIVARERHRGLMGKGRLQRLTQIYESFRSEGRLPATYEVVYGQAWARAFKQGSPIHDGEARVPLSSIGRREP